MKTKLLIILFSFLCLYANGQNYPKEENSLRIMSYNVRNCKGLDNITDYQRIADVINKVAPDILAIQELDSATQRNNGVYSLGELAKRTLMYPFYSPSIEFQGGKYGIGILSKEKPLKEMRISLPGKEEKRSFLLVEFEKYVFCCTHLSLTEADQVASVQIILNALGGLKKPVFLAGDMNAVINSPTQNAFKEHFSVLNNFNQLTFPADNPKECIDFIYGLKNGAGYTVLQKQVIPEPLASDHRPLFVDIRLHSPADKIFRTKPYLQNPVNNGITVTWVTNVPCNSWVEYGTDKQLKDKKQTLVNGQVVANNILNKIRLTGLQTGKTYYYRVCSQEITLYEAYKKEFGETSCSEIRSFKLPEASGTNFTAIVFNDLHKNKDLVDKLAALIKNIPYDLVFFNGDCVDDPKNESQAVDFISYLNQKVGADQVPVFYIRGNHEIRNAYSVQLSSLFDYVGDKTYGAFSWGDTRFVILDCGEDKPDSTSVYYRLNDFEGFRKEQVNFLVKELSGNSFRNAGKRILIHHIPIYGMPEKEYNPCLNLWGNVLAKAPFDLSVNAHMHDFTYFPKGTKGNNFPVIIGGGNSEETGTVMIISKRGNKTSLEVLNSAGKSLLHLDL